MKTQTIFSFRMSLRGPTQSRTVAISRITGLLRRPDTSGLLAMTVSCILLFLVPFVTFAAPIAQETKTYLAQKPLSQWVVMARVAAGETIDPTNIDTLPTNSLMEAAKTALALVAAGGNPQSSFGKTLREKLRSYYQQRQLGDSTLVNDDIWGLLALRALDIDSSDSVLQDIRSFIFRHQKNDGGWSWGAGSGFASDTNDTAAAIMALLESGSARGDQSITKAIAYLRAQQNDDGGFSYDRNKFIESDASSDAWVISALYKAGERPDAWKKNNLDPVSHLLSLKLPDGSFRYSKSRTDGSLNDTAWATIALAERFYPIRGNAPSPSSVAPLPPTLTPEPVSSGSGGGGGWSEPLFVPPTKSQPIIVAPPVPFPFIPPSYIAPLIYANAAPHVFSLPVVSVKKEASSILKPAVKKGNPDSRDFQSHYGAGKNKKAKVTKPDPKKKQTTVKKKSKKTITKKSAPKKSASKKPKPKKQSQRSDMCL